MSILAVLVSGSGCRVLAEQPAAATPILWHVSRRMWKRTLGYQRYRPRGSRCALPGRRKTPPVTCHRGCPLYTISDGGEHLPTAATFDKYLLTARPPHAA